MNINKKLISMNYSKGVTISPTYIVIHETGNPDRGADAEAHYHYFNTNPDAKVSAHFVVDEKQVIQCAELSWRCWHVGDNKGHSNITNSNTIAIEICVNCDGDYTQVRQNAIELTKWLIGETGIPAERVVRHYDASGKWCPQKMLDYPALWQNFKAQISQNVPVPAPSANLSVGDQVILNGAVYADSYGCNKGKTFKNKLCTITRIVDLSRSSPYLVNDGLGWVMKDSIRKA